MHTLLNVLIANHNAFTPSPPPWNTRLLADILPHLLLFHETSSSIVPFLDAASWSTFIVDSDVHTLLEAAVGALAGRRPLRRGTVHRGPDR